MALPPGLNKSVKNKIKANRNKGAQNFPKRPTVNLALTSLSNFAKFNGKNKFVTLKPATGFKKVSARKTAPTKKSTSKKPSSSFFDIFKSPSKTVKSKTTGKRNTVFKSSSLKVNKFSTTQDQFSKSTKVSVRGKKPVSVFNKKQSQIEKNKKPDVGFSFTTIKSFADFLKNNPENRVSFENKNKNSVKEARATKSHSVFFNDNPVESELPPGTPETNRNLFDDFVNLFTDSFSSSSSSLNDNSPSEVTTTGFVNDLGFPVNASEDDNPNLRPDIQLAGLGGLGSDESTSANSEESDKSFIEKLTENPIALGILGIGILLVATRGRR